MPKNTENALEVSIYSHTKHTVHVRSC